MRRRTPPRAVLSSFDSLLQRSKSPPTSEDTNIVVARRINPMVELPRPRHMNLMAVLAAIEGLQVGGAP